MKISRLMTAGAALIMVAGSAASALQTGQQPGQQPGQRQPGQQPAQPGAQQPGAQQPGMQQPGMQQPGRTEQAATGVQLIRSGWAINADVVGANNENIGDINDLVLDTNANRITHAVVSYGGVLGIGGRTVAVPWQSLNWNPEDRNFRAQLTRDRLEQMPEFDRDRVRQDRRNGQQRGFGFFGGDQAQQQGEDDGWSARGQYQQMIRQGQEQNLQGSVTNIERRAPMGGMSEGIIIFVTDEQQQELPVHLGPAWFIDRQDVMLRLNDRAQIQGTLANIQGRQALVASRISGPHGEFILRDEQGHPVWDAAQSNGANNQRTQPGMQQPRQPGQQQDQQLRQQDQQVRQGAGQTQPGQARRDGFPQDQPFGARGGQQAQPGQTGQQQAQAGQPAPGTSILVSDMTDQNIRTAGPEDLGELSDVVFDAFSGQIAFLVVNVGGFLGTDDAHAAIPFNLFRAEPDGRLTAQQIDRTTLAAAPRVEDNNWREIQDPRFADQVFQHFGQRNPLQGQQRQQPGQQQPGQQRELDQRQPGQQPGAQQPGAQRPGGQAAGQQGQYLQQFVQGQPAQVRGTIENIEPTTPEPGMQQIHAATIRTQEGRVQTVHLAPVNFLEQNNITLNRGEQVTIQGRTANLNGQQVVIAQSIEVQGRNVNLRGTDGAPAWDTRR